MASVNNITDIVHPVIMPFPSLYQSDVVDPAETLRLKHIIDELGNVFINVSLEQERSRIIILAYADL